MMQISDKMKTIIALACALILIGIGLFQGLTGIEFDEKVTNQVSMVLMIIAAFMIFSKKRRKPKQEDETGEKEENVQQIDDGDKE